MPLRAALSRSVKDRRGVAAIEFALIAPLLCLLLFGGVSIFDGLRASYVTEKATATMGDLLSRQTQMSKGYLDTAVLAFTQMSRASLEPVQMRVSSMVRRNRTFELQWTYNNANNTTLKTLPLPLASLPDIAEGDTLIVTETIAVVSTFSTGFLDPIRKLDNLSVNRPRFVKEIKGP